MVVAGSVAAQPLVSCILPTKNRAEFIPQAIQSFQQQTHPSKELVVVDNGEDSTESLIPNDPTIRYTKIAGRRTTGEMRNLCVKMSRGQIICHFDSDDWSAPERVTDQVTRLGEFGVVTGYHEMLFYDVRDGRSYVWYQPSSQPRQVLGTSLCYRRVWWQYHPFEPLLVGEDIKFFKQARREANKLVTTAPAGKLMVARVHHHQTCRKSLKPNNYAPTPPTSLPQEFPCVLTSSAI